jgi:hypothetical protein
MECTLKRMKAALARQPFDRLDPASVSLDAEHEARTHRLVVEEHGAGPADAVLAPEMRTLEAEPVADHVRERPSWLDRERDGVAVDLEANDQSVRRGAS